MSTHKWIDRICIGAVLLSLVITAVFANGEAVGIQRIDKTLGYEKLLFDQSKVHNIDIVIDDWDGFIANCTNEEYVPCTVVIDGEAVKNTGIRAKGNSSLSGVAQMDSMRYSFKIEFDHYEDMKNYHDLDKLELNNIIYDNTMMKDYLVYHMMSDFGVVSPLCSYAYITVNGEEHGLYLAVESLEDSFLRRNYGTEHGELYKPRAFSAELGQQAAGAEKGGMPGFGNMNLDISELQKTFEENGIDTALLSELDSENVSIEDLMKIISNLPEEQSQAVRESMMSGMHGGGMMAGGGMPGGFMSGEGTDAAKLKYTDDKYSTYSAIFDNAKTDITNADKNRLINSLKIINNGGDIESAVDVDAVIRYFVVNNFSTNGDSYTGTMINNYYLYEQDGKLSMLPWDYNMAFGSFMGSSADTSINEDINSPVAAGIDDRPMLAWILNNEEYTELYHKYFREFLSSTDIDGLIDQTKALLAPYVEKDPTKFCTYEEFEAGTEELKKFCRLRCEAITRQLDGDKTPVDTASLDLSKMNSGGGMRGGGMMGNINIGLEGMPNGGTGENMPFGQTK